MHRFALFIGLLIPATTFAATMTTVSLREGETNLVWSAYQNLSATRLPDGVRLEAKDETGVFLSTEKDFSPLPHGVEIVTSSEKPVTIEFGWHRTGDIESNLYNTPFTIEAGENVKTTLPLRTKLLWGPRVDQIAIIVPPDTSVVLHELTFVRWNMFERALSGILSLTDFDRYRAYGVNFIWGPQFVQTPMERAAMWTTLPPSSTSGMGILHALLLCAIAGLLFRHIRMKSGTMEEKRHAFFRSVIVTLLVCWLALDLRMGSEFLSWVHHDHRSLATTEESAPELRYFGDLYDYLEKVTPILSPEGRYLLFAPSPSPYLSIFRYFTYPAVPTESEEADLWVIYGRDDIRVTDGMLRIDGSDIEIPGTVVLEYSDDSFLFLRTR